MPHFWPEQTYFGLQDRSEPKRGCVSLVAFGNLVEKNGDGHFGISRHILLRNLQLREN